jgi:hypothetical protein
VDLGDAGVASSGDMRSFDYRGHLRTGGFLERPAAAENRLHPLWEEFRSARDDRSWKALTERIRAYARERGRSVFLSANGLARHVDLQVLGVWGAWTTRDGLVDIDESKVAYWRSIVLRGHEAAGKPVPVVLFHDWGMGTPPFPWLAVSPTEREIWMRTRGAEIYAAGGFFAFPVLGPFGCDAGRDGTIRTMARLTAYYQTQRDLYLRSRFLASEPLLSEGGKLSLAASWNDGRSALLIHAINREVGDLEPPGERGGAPREGRGVGMRRLLPREGASVRVPIDAAPRRVLVVSPDWEGEQEGRARLSGADGTVDPASHPAVGPTADLTVDLTVDLPRFEAYAVAVLEYLNPPDLSRLRDPARVILSSLWSRAPRSEFRLGPDGIPADACDLNGYLQGKLHTHLRSSPTFLVNAPEGGELLVKVRAVAVLGARLEILVDGQSRCSFDLPDRDGRNDSDALEHDRVLSFTIPSGRHRITLDNQGPDWAALSWIEFRGRFAQW